MLSHHQLNNGHVGGHMYFHLEQIGQEAKIYPAEFEELGEPKFPHIFGAFFYEQHGDFIIVELWYEGQWLFLFLEDYRLAEASEYHAMSFLEDHCRDIDNSSSWEVDESAPDNLELFPDGLPEVCQ